MRRPWGSKAGPIFARMGKLQGKQKPHTSSPSTMPPSLPSRKNSSIKLVVSIDIGTTYTAASYHIVGNKSKTSSPSFHEVNIASSFFSLAIVPNSVHIQVNKWPKQVHKTPFICVLLGLTRFDATKAFSDAKIPSVLYYDNDSVARLRGAETLDEVCSP